ncbi:hypothetical protein SAMN06264364_10411 [Quadrisphaera granulorum]|uniref:Uncharacterized protein n=1 Tax=Quadrisphaera granulorum TaxID=317664 RepID=A0A316ADP6_9ACTN|nr:hypothetical protein [Quadrisphaera granulorum]PWJ55090.1 hypothetical protein BXY45_10411 [Quadrisphaera granulorum]SZE95599.1 hypothetical protein SAMN06264364_10411 [Quadrisphaera granulorum]
MVTPLAKVTSLHDTVETWLTEDASPAGTADVDPLLTDLTVASLGPLTAFLVSTDRWTGTQQDLDDVHSLLDCLSPTAMQARALAELTDLGVLREGTTPGSLAVTPGLEKVLAGPALNLLEEITFDEVDDEV